MSLFASSEAHNQYIDRCSCPLFKILITNSIHIPLNCTCLHFHIRIQINNKEESVKDLIFDDEMDEIVRACIEDGNRNPLIQVHLFLFCQHFMIIYSTLKEKNNIHIPSFILGLFVKIEM